MTPLVSIVVPAYNAARFLPALCDSIQQQTFRDFEVLLLDDGSNDETATVISRYLTDSRFHFTRQLRNCGVSHGTRMLLEKVRGKYWCHPGADDVLKPNFIERRIAVAEKSGCVIVHGPSITINEQGLETDAPPHCPPMPEFLPGLRALAVLLEHDIINTPSVFVPVATTKQVLPHFQGDWKYAQDWFLWILHAAAGCGLAWDSTPLSFYRVHDASLSLRPDRAAVRDAEIRLVPLCALSRAAQVSPAAMTLWQRWKKPLYHLWLRRAIKLHRAGHLQSEWMRMAATAFYDRAVKGRVSLKEEVVWHLAGIARSTFAERVAARRNAFAVSGCAEIKDELFHAHRVDHN